MRDYIGGVDFSKILGYTGSPTKDDVKNKNLSPDDTLGKAGLEYQYDSQLRGVDGTQVIRQDSNGQNLPSDVTQAPQTGKSLGLTIDSALQQNITDSLTKYIKDSGADGGVGIVEDVNNGNIVGMVSLPTYDDNLFAKGITAAQYSQLANDPLHPLFDGAFQGGYAPGSTFKTITGTAVLSNNAITPDTIFSTGSFPYKKQTFYDFNHENLGNLNVIGALCKSSNIFFMKSADQLDTISNDNGINIIDDYATRFGVGQKTGIDLPGESPGVLTSIQYTNDVKKEIWLPGYYMSAVIGQQDTLVSPLQMADWASAIANGGTLYQPRVVDRIIDSDTKEAQQIDPKVIRSNIADPSVLNIIKQGMRCSATQGVADAVNTKVVDVAAKTGTAEFGIQQKNGSYQYSQAWVMGFFPYENPKYSFSFLLIKGGKSSSAAKSAQSVIEWFAETYADKLK